MAKAKKEGIRLEKTAQVPFKKKPKKSTDEPVSTMKPIGKSNKNIKIEFEDEFLNNSIAIHNILE